MKHETLLVKSNRQVIAKVPINIPETIVEAVELLGCDECLRLIIEQHRFTTNYNARIAYYQKKGTNNE